MGETPMLTPTNGDAYIMTPQLHRQLFHVLWLAINLEREVVLLLEKSQFHSRALVDRELASSLEDRWCHLEDALTVVVNSDAWPDIDDEEEA